MHVCRDIEYTGGVEIFLTAFLAFNQEFTHKLVCTAGKPGGQRAKKILNAGIEVKYIHGSIRQRRRQLQSIVDNLQKPILHCHLFKPELIGYRIEGCLAKITTKYCTYASDSQVGTGISGALRRTFDNRILDYLVTRVFNDVIVISNELENKWKWISKRIHRIPVSHITSFASPRAPRFLASRPILMVASRMVKEKQHDLLIDALAMMDYQKVYILGGGPARALIERKIRDHNLRDVHLIGTVPQARVIEYMDASDILLLTSRTEGLPLLIQEAMSRGLVVVATDAGGNDELIDDLTGVLVLELSPQAIADAVQGLVGCDIGSMGCNAIQKCKESFSLEVTSVALSHIYHNLLSDPVM
ncbi:glycosyltransferase family 4 protein [bacterium]|nr:glycosyltransferase family 4 protein [bacterium]